MELSNLIEYERAMPVVTVEGMTFFTPNRQCLWRVETLNTKEPSTIPWLQSMQPGEFLFDVGANVGMYTIYAGVRGVRVAAFEPEAQNFAVLCRNIQLNQLKDAIAFPVALGAAAQIDTLRVSGNWAGNSCNTFGADLDFKGKAAAFPLQQGAICMRMDEFTARYGQPDHIKIDVDGLEPAVVGGGRETIKRAKSMLIELDSSAPAHREIFEVMRELGFSWDDAQIQFAQRKKGAFVGIGEVIFTRRP